MVVSCVWRAENLWWLPYFVISYTVFDYLSGGSHQTHCRQTYIRRWHRLSEKGMICLFNYFSTRLCGSTRPWIIDGGLLARLEFKPYQGPHCFLDYSTFITFIVQYWFIPGKNSSMIYKVELLTSHWILNKLVWTTYISNQSSISYTQKQLQINSLDLNVLFLINSLLLANQKTLSRLFLVHLELLF